MTDITRILQAIAQDVPNASDQLLTVVYDELRRLASAKLRHEHPGQTLQATDLAHEAWLRMIGKDGDECWDSRGHFFAAAAEAMRRILVERARRRARDKHGGDRQRVELRDEDAADQLGVSRATAYRNWTYGKTWLKARISEND